MNAVRPHSGDVCHLGEHELYSGEGDGRESQGEEGVIAKGKKAPCRP